MLGAARQAMLSPSSGPPPLKSALTFLSSTNPPPGWSEWYSIPNVDGQSDDHDFEDRTAQTQAPGLQSGRSDPFNATSIGNVTGGRIDHERLPADNFATSRTEKS
jgi:hypothetical protein